MKKAILFAFALTLLSNRANSATNYNMINRDSLKAIINNRTLPDTTRLRLAALLARSFDYIMPDSMLFYTRILREESVKVNYSYGIVCSFVYE